MQQLPQPPKMPDGMPNPMQGRKRRALESLAQQMPQQPQFPNSQSSGQGQQRRNLVSGMAENAYAQVYRAKRSPQDAGAGAGSSPLDMFKDMAKNFPQKAKEAIGAFKEKAKAAIEKMKGGASGGAPGASPGAGGEATGEQATSGLDGRCSTIGNRDLTAVGREGPKVSFEKSLLPEGRNRRALEDIQQLPQPPKMPDGMPNPGRKRQALESLAQQMPQQPQFPNSPSSGQGQQRRNLVSGMAENEYAQVYRAKRSPQDAGTGSLLIDTYEDLAKNIPHMAYALLGRVFEAEAREEKKRAEDLSETKKMSGYCGFLQDSAKNIRLEYPKRSGLATKTKDGDCSTIGDRDMASLASVEGPGLSFEEMGRMPRRRGRSPVELEHAPRHLAGQMEQVPQMPDGMPRPDNLPIPPQMPFPQGRRRRALENLQQLPQPPKMPDGMPNPIPGRKRRALESLAQQMPQQPQFPNSQSSGQGQQRRNFGSEFSGLADPRIYSRAKRSPQGGSPIGMFTDMAKNFPQMAMDAAGSFKDAATSAMESMKGMASGIPGMGSMGGMMGGSSGLVSSGNVTKEGVYPEEEGPFNKIWRLTANFTKVTSYSLSHPRNCPDLKQGVQFIRQRSPLPFPRGLQNAVRQRRRRDDQREHGRRVFGHRARNRRRRRPEYQTDHRRRVSPCGRFRIQVRQRTGPQESNSCPQG
ncbi:unnamed protein product [Nesidiocoris tenuis]|uniref:Uncharacterized protein n=1 Tax=Nesidiocoris tenuis TaxID=355587 RepID=A0A6H5HRB1_9HEMI|nr:unnamed protein product [Nesidiocoris tenuis]